MQITVSSTLPFFFLCFSKKYAYTLT